jgi:hypothetical protein
MFVVSQAPFRHTGTWHAGASQTWPQRPQFSTSLVRSLHPSGQQ